MGSVLSDGKHQRRHRLPWRSCLGGPYVFRITEKRKPDTGTVRTIASNAVSIAIARGGPVGSRVLLLLAIARFSSSDALAAASYAVAMAEAVRVVADGGVEIWAVREIARAAGPMEEVQSTSAVAVVKLVYGVIGSLLATLVTLLTSSAGIGFALLAGAFVLSGELLVIGLIHHVSRSTPQKLVPISLLSAAVTVIAGVLALANGVDVLWAVAIAAGVEMLTALYVLGRLRAAKALLISKGIGARSLYAIRQSLPTTVYCAVIALYSRLDAVALNLVSAAALATYSVAYRVTQPFMFVFGAVALALYASQTREVNRSFDQFRSALRKTLLAVLVSVSATSVLIYSACALFISSVIPAYTDSLGTLQILCAVMPIVAVNCVSIYSLFVQGRLRALLGLGTANLAVMAILLAVLVPRHGAEGAAFAYLGSQLLASAFLYVLHARARLERAPA